MKPTIGKRSKPNGLTKEKYDSMETKKISEMRKADQGGYSFRRSWNAKTEDYDYSYIGKDTTKSTDTWDGFF